MFEDEIKMEEKSSNVIPLLMALGLVFALVGGLVYFIMQSKRTVTEQEASAVATALLKAQGPEQVHFHGGPMVKASVDEKIYDPHYKLLEKIGVLKLGKPTVKGTPVIVTPEGKKLLDAVGTAMEKNPDGSDGYTATLATRKLLRITKIEMLNPGRANMEFEWNWEPTELGLDFDIDGPSMKSMQSWDRLTLIQKYGADYYRNSKVKKEAVALVWDEKKNEWRPLAE